MTSLPRLPSLLQYRLFLRIAFSSFSTEWMLCPSSSSSFNLILQPFGSKFHISRWSYLRASVAFSATLDMTPAACLHSPHLSFSASLIFAQTYLICFCFLCLWCYLSCVYAYDVICLMFMLMIFHVGHMHLIYGWVGFGNILFILLIMEVFNCWYGGWLIRWHIYMEVFLLTLCIVKDMLIF